MPRGCCQISIVGQVLEMLVVPRGCNKKVILKNAKTLMPGDKGYETAWRCTTCGAHLDFEVECRIWGG